ncbi:MAG: AMP-binding protein [Gammaproteobacteria bacterium]|nr:AMP-binding protein [Gammaproteobacteria bacterium]
MILHHQFIKTAKNQGSKLAFIDKTTGRDLTYSQALIASLILSRFVRNFDEKYIGIMLPTSAGCYLSVLATQYAGKIPVMINYSTGAEQNVEYAREKCGFNTVITSRTVLSKVGCPEMPGMIFVEDLLKRISTTDKIGAALRSKLPTSVIIASTANPSPDDTAVILFTSGSEKAPKGVELSHRNITANLDGIVHVTKLTSDDIMMSILPFFHVFGFTTNLWLPVYLGMTAVTYANPLDAKTIAGIIKEQKPTIMIGTPFFLMSYERFAKPGDFSSLRLVVAGADKMPEWLFDSFQRNHNIQVIEGYGATETSPVISVNPPGESKRGSIGRPLYNVEVKITDLDTGETLPPGKEGKILARGDNIMKGYFGDVEETSLKIENGWYETGDMGLLDDEGYLWHKGRLKRFVKIGGEMVSLVHVESVIEELLPEGVECCVVEIPDARKGAVIAVATNAEIDVTPIKKQASEKLPPIALPKHYVVLEEMPKMGSGKIDFRTTTQLVKAQLTPTDSKSKSKPEAVSSEAE